MLLRTVMVSLAAFACGQFCYGQSGVPGRPAANTRQEMVRPAAYQTDLGTQVPWGAPMMGDAQIDYGMTTMPMDTAGGAPVDYYGGCDTAGGATYVPWWHKHFVWSYWKLHGLPSPWCPPGNLTGHIPYECCGTYYYYRPYNWFHIPAQQAEVANYDGDPRNPYDNRPVFDGLYDGL